MTQTAPHEVVLYGGADCHLCEQAASTLEALRRAHPFTLRRIDIHTNPELARRYLLEIPVVTVDGVEAARGPLDAAAVRAVRAALGL